MSYATCKLEECGERFILNSQQRRRHNKCYCSSKCAEKDKIKGSINFYKTNTSTGLLKIENTQGKIIKTLRFLRKSQLKQFMDIYSGAPILIVKFD